MSSSRITDPFAITVIKSIIGVDDKALQRSYFSSSLVKKKFIMKLIIAVTERHF